MLTTCATGDATVEKSSVLTVAGVDDWATIIGALQELLTVGGQ